MRACFEPGDEMVDEHPEPTARPGPELRVDKVVDALVRPCRHPAVFDANHRTVSRCVRGLGRHVGTVAIVHLSDPRDHCGRDGLASAVCC
jgi:hypothetical protein